MVLVGSGETLDHIALAFHPRLPEELKESIATILTGLDQSGSGRELLRQAQLDGLVPTSDGDYDRHRQIVLEVLGVDYRMAQGAEGSE